MKFSGKVGKWDNEQLLKFWWRFGSPTGYRDCFPDSSLLGDICTKLQFIHTVNGDGSKTAKIIKSTINGVWLRPAANQSATRFEEVRAISTCRDSSDLLEPGRSRFEAKFCYTIWSQTGSKQVADLLARASSLLAS